MTTKLRKPSPYVVLAIPTIKERADILSQTVAAFERHTCQPVEVHLSHAEGGWAAGLNEIWSVVRGHQQLPDVFVCGSDDMQPEDDNWLPPLLDHLERGAYPASQVIDPRWTNFGGHGRWVPDGTPSNMSSFPVIDGRWGDAIFPLPEDLSYFADNLIAVKLREAGIECVAVPSSKIRHLRAMEGRGFGHGSEEEAMIVHSERYTLALEELGIQRDKLPAMLRGPAVRRRGRARA